MSVWRVLKLALRAAIWRRTPEPRPVGLPSLLMWAAALAAVRIALQFVTAGLGGGFNPYGLNAVVAWIALEIAVAAFFVPPAARATALSAMLVLTVIAELATQALKLGLVFLPSLPATDGLALDQIAPNAIFVIVSLWWIGAMVAVLRSFALQSRSIVLGRVAALWVALVVVTALVPHAPVFLGRDFDVRSANLWELLLAQLTAPKSNDSPTREASNLDQSQSGLLKTEVATLTPPTKGATDIYALGIAGWAGDDVFLKELDGGLAALAGSLPIHGRTLRLANHADTLQSVPLASPRNFAAAVKALAQVMNKDEDVLLLLLTSHGVQTGFGLRFPNGTVTELTPADLAATLDNAGIKNRLVIVSACFAGIFLPPLANDNTIVLTAADATHTSFGCAPERDWTYFGDAFFRQSLRPGWDLQHAFDNARVLIQGWELMDRAQPSNPQAHFGPALVAKLAPFFASEQSAGR